MTVIVTRDVEDRYRGFLSSVMLEIAPGVYTGPRLTRAVRERVWRVLADWHGELRRGAILMTWRDPTAAGGQSVLLLGEPRRELVDLDGVLLVRREIWSSFSRLRSLKIKSDERISALRLPVHAGIDLFQARPHWRIPRLPRPRGDRPSG